MAVRSPGADVRSTIAALQALGVPVDTTADGDDMLRVGIHGLGTADAIGRLRGSEVDCGNSGTTIRLLAGAAASGTAALRLTGDASLRRRPMERVAAPLRAMGAGVRSAPGGTPPLEVTGHRPLHAIDHRPTVASAQVLGSISLAALAAEGRTTVEVPGPTRDHTERLLAWLGARIARGPAGPDGATVTTIDGPAALRARDLTVPGDPSSAAAWLVAGTLHPDAEVRLVGVALNPSRLALVSTLAEMGARIDVLPAGEVGPEPVGDLVVRTADTLRPIVLAGGRIAGLIDELPLLAVAMAAVDGWSEVRDAGELRVKESDRIATMTAALTAAGALVEERPDGWRIRRGRPADAAVSTDGDHRIAMAMAVAAWSGVARTLTLDDPACVAVSYPRFWSDAARLGATS